MRITCPNCSSQYEVAEGAIPPAGRDVQCAKCSHIWFQASPAAPMMLDDAAPAEAAAPAGATFRSARVDRAEETPAAEAPVPQEPAPAPQAPAPEAPVAEAPAPTPPAEEAPAAAEPTAEPADAVPPTSLTDDIKRILTEERAYSAPDGAPTDAPATEPTPTPAAPVEEQAAPAEPAPEPEAPAAELSLDAAPRMFDAPPVEEPQSEPAPAAPAAEAQPEAPQTLQEASSLREVLNAEAQNDTVATVAEPTLQDLGLRRPQQPAMDVPTAEPAAAEPAAADLRARDAFTNIDDLNSKLDAQSQQQAGGDGEISLGSEASVGNTSAFSTGFAVACFICITAALLYMVAPRLASAVPAVAGVAENYAAGVDSGRMVIQELYYGGEGEPGFPNFFSNIMSSFRG